MFFTIEFSPVPHSRENADWREFEKHPVLWTARNRVKVAIDNDPRLHGHFRIIRCVPLTGIDYAAPLY